MRRVLIIGAGPGGLSAGMILAGQGYEVDIFEQAEQVGGRNARLTLADHYHFDTGPTFLMLPSILEEIFQEAGKKLADYVELKRIDPMYQLIFPKGQRFYPTNDPEKMANQIEQLFPGDYEGYLKFRREESSKYKALYPCLQLDYGSLFDYLRPTFLKALPKLDAFRSIYSRLSDCFNHEEMRLALTFQAKYLGMSPWSCPATFAMIPYIEHEFGVWHTMGGLNQISQGMAKAFEDLGGEIHLEKRVKKICTENGKAIGIELEDGQMICGDCIVLNGDFAYNITGLLDEKDHPSWSTEKIMESDYSCSTFMIYLGLDTQYDLNHHNIVFAADYQKNIDGVSRGEELSEDFSFYVQNPCKTDPTLAPEGHSTLYILVPVANLRGPIDWEGQKATLREKIIDKIEEKFQIVNIRDHIQVEKIITPIEWEKEYSVYKGAVFNLSHTIKQMLYFRPHNSYNDLENLYLVGGGTHPGSGLPTIYESGRISARLIQEKLNS